MPTMSRVLDMRTTVDITPEQRARLMEHAFQVSRWEPCETEQACKKKP